MPKHTDEPHRARDSEALERILRSHTEQHEAGKLIELDRNHGLIIQVRSGRVLATTVDRAGHETLCVLRGPGSILGLESLAGMVLPYFLWTLSEVELAIAPAANAREWLKSNAHPGQALLRAALDELQACLAERMALHGSTTTRLARLLLASADDADSKGPAAMMLTLPKNVLARMLQMRPETLSRVLRKLEEIGAIQLDPQLRVLSRERLIDVLSDRAVD